MKVFLDLAWFFKQEKKSYLLGISILIIVAILQLIPPKIIGMIADEIGGQTLTWEKLGIWILVLMVIAVLLYVLRYFWRIYIFGSAVKLSKILRKRLYEHFTNMSSYFYQQKRIGDLMAHATNDIQAIQQTAGSGVLTFVDSVATGGFVILAMATTISWKLTLISLLPMPLIALLTNWYGTKLHARFKNAQEAFSFLNDKTQESISGMKVIKTFGQEKEDLEDFCRQSEEVVKKNISVAKIDALYDPTISACVGMSFFLSIGFGAKYVTDGSMTIGELVAFTTYLGLLIWPMLAFGWFFNIVERGRASNERVNRLLSEKIEINDIENGVKQVPSGDIIFNVQSFQYPSSEKQVLSNVKFSLIQGQTLGITGKTGAGKTTLIKLLLREFDGYEGEISIDNIPIHYYRLDYFKKAFGYVPQDHFLFSTTIRENIAFAKPEASDEEVIAAAKLANIHEDIKNLTEGYRTVVGERGVSLSGGQKQRISIARALLLNPEILILDDSLSAVDAKTEETILSALKENREEKTTIIISHRLSAIQHADTILVLDEGKIKQQGNHELLVNEDGWYREMYLHQQLESLVEHGG